MRKLIDRAAEFASRVAGPERGPAVLNSLCGLALVLRVLLVVFRNFGFPPGWGGEMPAVASALVSGRGFADLYWIATGPTGATTPVYPILLAGIYLIAGNHTVAAGMVALLLNAALSALVTLIVYHLGKVFFGHAAGLIAAALWALYPLTGHTEARFIWNTSLYVLLATALLLIAVRTTQQIPLRRWALFWLFAGLCILVDAAALIFVVVCVGWLFVFRERRAQRWLVAAACVGLIVAPWVIRNWLVMGRPVLRTNLGLELATGIEDPEFATLKFQSRLPSRYAAELEKYRTLGEIAYFDQKLDLARTYIRQNPEKYLHMAARRCIAYWTGTPELAYIYWPSWRWLLLKRVIYFLPVLGALGGFFVLRRSPYVWIAVAVLVLQPIVYYFTHAFVRYREPLNPLLIVLTAGFLHTLLERFGRSWGQSLPERTRPTAAGSPLDP